MGIAAKPAFYNPKRPYEALYNVLVFRAGTRGISVLLTYEEFLEFTVVKECHYCGEAITWAPPYGKKVAGKQNVRSNIDRKDNAVSYTKDNSVVCCPNCNYTKSNTLSYEEMLVIGRMRAERRLKGDAMTHTDKH